VNPSAGGPVRLAAALAPSAPPGYGESGAWRGFWSQVGPPDTGPGDYSDDDLADLPGSTGLTEPMPMINPGLPTAPTAVPPARSRPAQPPTPRPAPAPRPVTPASAPPWAPPSADSPSAPAPPSAAPPSAAPPSAPAPPPAAPPPAPAPPAEAAPASTAGSRRAPTRHDRDRDRGNRTRWGAAYPIVLAGTAAGLAYLWRGPENVRGGVLVVAVTLLLAAAARLVLPERRAGLLVSRRRFADVAAFSILGLALLVAGLVLPAQG
jgi:outer membrane biosynthesis protein TonB